MPKMRHFGWFSNTMSWVVKSFTVFVLQWRWVAQWYATLSYFKGCLKPTKRTFFGELFCPFLPWWQINKLTFSAMTLLEKTEMGGKMPGLYRIQLENTYLLMGAILHISPVNVILKVAPFFVAPSPRYFPIHSAPFHCYTLSTVMWQSLWNWQDVFD